MGIFGPRAWLAGWTVVLATLALSGLARPAAAQTEGPADFLERFSQEAIFVLADQALSDQSREQAFRRLFTGGFDVTLISRFVLGRHWRRASLQERKEYSQLFEDFVVATYARRLGGYSGETLTVGATRGLGERRADVESVLNRPEGAPIQVTWRLHRPGDDWKIVDVVVEGVSMALTQRSEFASVIAKANGRMDGLLQALRKISRQNKLAVAQ